MKKKDSKILEDNNKYELYFVADNKVVACNDTIICIYTWLLFFNSNIKA